MVDSFEAGSWLIGEVFGAMQQHASLKYKLTISHNIIMLHIQYSTIYLHHIGFIITYTYINYIY